MNEYNKKIPRKYSMEGMKIWEGRLALAKQIQRVEYIHIQIFKVSKSSITSKF
jgi:hypothetical protein